MAKMTTVPGKYKVNFQTAMKELDNINVKIGWFESAKYEDGTSVAFVAAIAEHGAAGKSIPPRPIFKPTIAAQSTAWIELMGRGVRSAIKGKITAHNVMDKMGMQAAGDCRKTISEIVTPPLSVVTLLARKRRKEGGKVAGKVIGELHAQAAREGDDVDVSGVSRKPLVDSSLMFNTLTSIVQVTE